MKKLFVTLFSVLAAVAAFFALACSASANTQDSLDEFYFQPSWNIYSGAAKYMPQEKSILFYSYLGNVTATCSLESEIDMRYYGYFIFDLYVNEDSEISEPYNVELTLYSDYEESSFSQNVFPSSSSRITFDLSDFEHREQITYIGLKILPADRSEGYMSFTISNVRLSGKVDKDASERYMCANYASDGADISYGDDGIKIRINEDTVMRGDVTVVEGSEAPDVIRIVYSAGESIGDVTLTLRSDSGSVSRNQVTFPSAYEPQILLVPLGFKAMPSQIAFTFQNASGKELTLHAIEVLSTSSDTNKANGTSLSCRLQKGDSYIVVSGSLPAEFANRRNSATLALYELEPYQDINSIYSSGVSPIATYPMSTKFEFRVPLNQSNYLALFSKYAVVVCIDGQPGSDVVMMPRYIENAFERDDLKMPAPNAFKGIMTENGVAAESAGAGTVILDVYLDELISMKNIGQLHSVYNGYYYFTMSIVGELDRRIGSASVSGADVILRFLVRGGKESLPFAYPSTSDALLRSMRADDWEGMMYIHAVTDFLISRYNGGDYGSVKGIIVGSKINEAASYNSMGQEYTLSEYVNRYMSVLRVICASVSKRASDVKVYVPISGEWSDTAVGGEVSGHYDTPLLLYAIAESVQREGYMPLSLAIESDVRGEKGELITKRVGVDNINILINEMSSPLGSTCGFDELAFIWQPDLTDDDRLRYEYCRAYGLLYASGVDVFAVDLYGALSEDISDTMLSFAYIDTKNVLVHLPPDLGAFLYKNDEVISTDGKLRYRAMREISSYSFEGTLSYDVLGRYDYFDFTSSYDSLGWRAGSGCTAIESSPSSAGQRMLEARSNGDLALYYIFDEPEDMSMLSTLALDMKVKGEGEATVTLMIDGDEKVEISAIADTEKSIALYFDISEYSAKNLRSLKLSVTGSGVGGVEIERIYGLSDTLDDHDLTLAILESRNKLDVGGIDLGMTVTIFAGVALVLSLVGVAVISIRSRKK